MLIPGKPGRSTTVVKINFISAWQP